jgi:large subunit ribosomal protein L29
MSDKHARAFQSKLQAMSPADMQKELLELRREQFNLRMARVTGDPVKPNQFSRVRRNIARLKTRLGEQQRQTQGKQS